MAHRRCARRKNRDIGSAFPLELQLSGLQFVADFVVAFAFENIGSSIPAYIRTRLHPPPLTSGAVFDIPCEDVGRVMRLRISGFELFTTGRKNAERGAC